MSRYFVWPDSPEGWARGLAKPEHWRKGFSAHSLAYTWHPCDGFPPSVQRAFTASELGPLEFIAGVPEYKVALPGGDTASQTDVFVLARAAHTRTASNGTVAIAVEGKAREPFGDKTVAQWRVEASPGKVKRLGFLCRVLGLADDDALGSMRYQLLHRTASPLIEAERLGADHAVMLVHSFGSESVWFEEFASFVALLGAEAKRETIVCATKSTRSLYVGWVSDPHPEVAE